MSMTFIDLAIIYLACGAPLSMHYFFGSSRTLNLNFAGKLVLVALVWPIAAFLLIRDVRRGRAAVTRTGQNDLDRRLDSIRIDIERTAFAKENATTVFEFRELFARYTGLAQASTLDIAQGPSNEMFLLTGHPNADLATRCLDRKASNRLARHAVGARTDFVDHIAALSIDAEKVVLSASLIAELVGDKQAVTMLGELAVGSASSPDKWPAPERVHAAVS